MTHLTGFEALENSEGSFNSVNIGVGAHVNLGSIFDPLDRDCKMRVNSESSFSSLNRELKLW